MAATQIHEMRVPHEAILDEILANPFYTLKQLAAKTGYSVSWLSQMIRSDCFRAAYESRRGPIEAGIMAGISDRLNAIAHLAIDNMEEVLTSAADADTKIDAFDRVMHRTGYAPNSPKTGGAPQPGVQNNTFLIAAAPDELKGLREQIINGTAERVTEALPEPERK